MVKSELTYNKAGEAVGFDGPDAIKVYQAASLGAHIQLWQKTGMIPTRGYGITKMLAAANALLDTHYTRSNLDACVHHLGIFVQEMKAALPHRTI